MFEDVVKAAVGASGAAGIAAWAQVENAACARRLSASADLLDARLAADGSADREQWCLDNWDSVAAEVAAGQGVSLGVASHQLLIADALRERLPRVAEVFVAGAISYRMVAAVVARTRVVPDREVMAKIDTELAAHVGAWGTLSVAKLEGAIDYWVDRYDPAAVRRNEQICRGRHVDVADGPDGSGLGSVEAWLFAQDAAALDQRLDALAAAVCDRDPRTIDQRRADAMAAVIHGAERLPCACGEADCAAARMTPSNTVVHVVAREESLTDGTPARLDGAEPPALTSDPLTGPAECAPGYLMSGAILPAPLLAAKLATTAARIVPIVHPGEAPPEPRHSPSRKLADFVRCRDLTCRFPGCDEPAVRCDLDHTIAHPKGPTQASNLKCLCRKHHLLKTFWGWRDVQHPDGTVDWLSPVGQRYTTYPGSRLLFPALCRPTAPAAIDHTVELLDDAVRTLKMPRRKTTRAQDRVKAIEAERRANQPYADERNQPPPF